jgi:hypothetical protein
MVLTSSNYFNINDILIYFTMKLAVGIFFGFSLFGVVT